MDGPLFDIQSLAAPDPPPGWFERPAEERAVLRLATRWVTDVIAGPHHERKGTMCPHTPRAIRANRILLGASLAAGDSDALAARFLDLAARHLEPPPARGSEAELTTLLIAFPNDEADPKRSPVQQAIDRLQMRYLESRRMLGVFRFRWIPRPAEDGPALPWLNPLPVVGMRHMVRGDDVFLSRPDALAVYHRFYPPLACPHAAAQHTG
jgi:hypothetical protein